jgi:UDP-glucose 4-epimerase
MDLRREYEHRRVIVTGAAGFVGSHLVDALVAHGARVVAVDDLSDGREANLASSRSRIEFVCRSVVQKCGLDELLAGADVVFHLAANASVPRSVEDPDDDFEANVLGTYRVLESARHVRAKRIVFTSSAAVYGDPVREPMDESHPFHPKSPYGGSKLAAEFLLDSYSRCFDLDHRRVRLFNTYGPRQRKYVMFDLLEKLRADSRNLAMLGSGDQVRDYSYVSDTVDAILLVGAHPQARGRVYNVAGDHAIDIRELIDLVIRIVGIPRPEITFTGESWKGDIVRWIGDTRALRALGFSPRVDLEEGIRRLVDWHRTEFAAPW